MDIDKRIGQINAELAELRIKWGAGSKAMKLVIEKNDVPPLQKEKERLLKLKTKNDAKDAKLDKRKPSFL